MASKKKALALNENYGLYEQNKTAWISSVQVANIFGKRHDHVIRDVRNIIGTAPVEFTGPNFGESSYKDSTGRKLPMYLLTRDGFSLLAMGFTGEKAMAFKIAWLDKFNAKTSGWSTRCRMIFKTGSWC